MLWNMDPIFFVGSKCVFYDFLHLRDSVEASGHVGPKVKNVQVRLHYVPFEASWTLVRIPGPQTLMRENLNIDV